MISAQADHMHAGKTNVRWKSCKLNTWSCGESSVCSWTGIHWFNWACAERKEKSNQKINKTSQMIKSTAALLQEERDTAKEKSTKQQPERIWLQLILEIEGRDSCDLKRKASQLNFTSHSSYCFKWEAIKIRVFLSGDWNYVHHVKTFSSCLSRTSTMS